MAKIARMFDFKKPKMAPPKQEDNLWEELRESLREQFPNPQREGCPEREVLIRLAQGRMPLEQAEAWLDHFSRCSQCFHDFEQFQFQARQRRRMRWQVAAGVAVVLGCSAALWLTYTHQKAIRAQSHPRALVSPVAQLHPTQPLPVALHLENVLTSRDTDEANSNPPQLPRTLLSLSIYLPPGSEAGSYEIELLRHRADSTPLVTSNGTSAMEGGMVVLRSTADLSTLEPGIYILGFRPSRGSWRYSPVSIP
jgi:hypothetical protein